MDPLKYEANIGQNITFLAVSHNSQDFSSVNSDRNQVLGSENADCHQGISSNLV